MFTDPGSMPRDTDSEESISGKERTGGGLFLTARNAEVQNLTALTTAALVTAASNEWTTIVRG